MSKRTTFTTISPLPVGISRELVLDTLHNHAEMIDLNPLIIERHQISPPPNADPEEVEIGCAWWSMTDEISYMPGIKSDLTYVAAFQDLKDGLRTHSYAPMGTHIRGRWTLGGTLPGEPSEPVELGLVGVPAQGLYLREDVDIRCNFLMAGFVKKTILKSHGVLVDKIVSKAGLTDGHGTGTETGSETRAGPDMTSMSAASMSSRRSSSVSPTSSDHKHDSVAKPVRAPTGGLFLDNVGHDGEGRSDSAPNLHRGPLSNESSGASSPARQSQNLQLSRGWPGHPQQQAPNGDNASGGRPFYAQQRAAASETGLGESLAPPSQAPNPRYSSAQQYTVAQPYQYQWGDQPPQIPPLDELWRDRRARGDDGGADEMFMNFPNGISVPELRGSEAQVSGMR